MGELLEKGEEVEQQFPTTEESREELTVQKDRVLDIVRQIAQEVNQSESIPMEPTMVNEPMKEAEQPLLSPEEAAANLAARNSEATGVDMEMDENLTAYWNLTERVEETIDEAPEHRDVRIVTDEEKYKRTSPREEDVDAIAVAVRIYQRRPARDESSEKRTVEERRERGPGQSTGRYVESQPRNAAGGSVRRRRLIMDEDTEEEDDVLFTPIDHLPSRRQSKVPAVVNAEIRTSRGRGRKSRPQQRRNQGKHPRPWSFERETLP